MSQREKAVQRLIYASSELQKTLGLMLWIYSVLEMHLSSLLVDSGADKI